MKSKIPLPQLLQSIDNIISTFGGEYLTEKFRMLVSKGNFTSAQDVSNYLYENWDIAECLLDIDEDKCIDHYDIETDGNYTDEQFQYELPDINTIKDEEKYELLLKIYKNVSIEEIAFFAATHNL